MAVFLLIAYCFSDAMVCLAYGWKPNLNKHCKDYEYVLFNDIEEAKLQCKREKNCTAIYDVECGVVGTYYLCPEIENVIEYHESSCVHEKIIIGKNLPSFLHIYSFIKLNVWSSFKKSCSI